MLLVTYTGLRISWLESMEAGSPAVSEAGAVGCDSL